MRWFKIMREQKLLSLSLLLVTLSIGIVIGTLFNTGVHAARGQAVASDATPLVVPNAVQLGNEFTKLAKKLEPSVVYITADYTPKPADNPHKREQSQDPGDNNDDGMDLFRRFFKNGPLSGDVPPRAFKEEQSGAGFIVAKKGYIITNNHVVSKVDHIKVRLHTDDTTEYGARVVGFAPETDLAVLKIDPKSQLTPVTIGNSDAVQVGDWAVAIGSPFGLEASVTAGIVSALGRNIGTLQLQRFIQTDAAINPGNSGGPLLNIRGEVIGVNTMIATQSGGYQGVGFALPVNRVVRVYNDIIRNGRVTRGSMGVSWTKTKSETLRALGVEHGVIVNEVRKDGPADKAGLKSDDIITGINGQPVKDGDELVARVADLPVGSQATLNVDRDGKKMDFKLSIQDRTKVFADDPRIVGENAIPENGANKGEAQVKFGISIRATSEEERDLTPDKHGIAITRVEPGSFAEDVGLMEKDLVVSINRQQVNSVEDIRKIQATMKPGDPVAFRVVRQILGGRAKNVQPRTATMFLSGTLPQN